MIFLILCLAAFAMVAFVTSAVLGVAFQVLRPQVRSLSPTGQARMFLVATLLPLFVASIVLMAALAPSFGWIADHYDILEVHSHPHLCFDHPASSWPTLTILTLAAALSLRFLWTMTVTLCSLRLSLKTQKLLNRDSAECGQLGLRILPTMETEAFVIGLFTPTLYISRGLLDGQASQLEVVLAHERAHLSRMDPLRRFVSRIGVSFHLPGIGRWLDRCHARAQEMSADEMASICVGNRKTVAQTLVSLAKDRVRRRDVGAIAFSDSEVQARVLLLLDAPSGRDWPCAKTLAAAALACLIAAGLGADSIHHQVESLLGLFGR